MSYTDKGRITQKQRNLSDCVKAVVQDLKQTARTEEQSVQTSKLLYKLADSAVRLVVEEIMNNPVPEQIEEIESDMYFENTDCDTPCRTERYL